MTTTITAPPIITDAVETTTRLVFGISTVTVRTDIPDASRRDALDAALAVLDGVDAPNAFNGPTRVYGNPASLLPCWDVLIVDIEGLDDPTGNGGYHWHTFTRDCTTPITRLRAMTNNTTDTHRANAANVLAALTTRTAVTQLTDILKGN